MILLPEEEMFMLYLDDHRVLYATTEGMFIEDSS